MVGRWLGEGCIAREVQANYVLPCVITGKHWHLSSFFMAGVGGRVERNELYEDFYLIIDAPSRRRYGTSLANRMVILDSLLLLLQHQGQT